MGNIFPVDSAINIEQRAIKSNYNHESNDLQLCEGDAKSKSLFNLGLNSTYVCSLSRAGY